MPRPMLTFFTALRQTALHDCRAEIQYKLCGE